MNATAKAWTAGALAVAAAVAAICHEGGPAVFLGLFALMVACD